jgi:hypothetical protein
MKRKNNISIGNPILDKEELELEKALENDEFKSTSASELDLTKKMFAQAIKKSPTRLW